MSHIAFLIPGLNKLTGAERQVLLLARGLRRRGWRVTVIALSGSASAAATELNANHIGFLNLGMRKGFADPGGWARFHRWLRRNQPDIVHAHLPHASWLARWSRLAAPIPLLVDTIHTSATGGLGRRLSYRLSNWLSDSVTAVSQAAAQSHLKAGLVSKRKLHVLPNGVEIEKWKPNDYARLAARRAFGFTDEFVWLAAGRLDPVKDYPTLLQAITCLPDSARLLIAGQGPLETELKRLCTRLGIADRVRFLGFQPDLWRSMQAADAFVLSSIWEDLPLVLLEAGACGLPSVATDVPGTREAVIVGETAWLVPPRAADALALRMASLMHLPLKQRFNIGEQARQFVLGSFNLESVLDRWEELYAGLEGVPAPRPQTAFETESAKALTSSTVSR